MPTKDEPGKYLETAARAFFGDTVPAPVALIFDPAGARAAVKSQAGGANEPKKKDDLIAALVAMPAYADKEGELKKKKTPELN